MDPQKRHLKKLKRLQSVRKEKLKEKNSKTQRKKDKENAEDRKVEEENIPQNDTDLHGENKSYDNYLALIWGDVLSRIEKKIVKSLHFMHFHNFLSF